MHSLIAFALAWLAAHPVEVVVYACLALMALVAQLPARYARLPVLGLVVRFIDRVSVLVHRDAPGTLKWPGVPSILLAAALDVAGGRDAVAPAPVPPSSNHGGFVSLRALVLVGLLALGLPVGLLACSAAQRAGECGAAPAGESALALIVDVVVRAIAGGAPVDPMVTTAIDTVEGAVKGGVSAACADAARAAHRPPLSARVRAALAARPAPVTR